MTPLKFALAAGLLIAAPGAALAQEAPQTCNPQTVAQWLGLEPVAGCTDGGEEVGDDNGGATVDAEGPLQGLLQAHESSGGKSTAALERANTRSGGAVLSAFSRASEDDQVRDDNGNGNGRPDHAGRPDDAGAGRR